MGFLTTQDRIGALTYAANMITLQPSLLTIGGQQYRVPVLTANLTGLTPYALYMVYVVLTGPNSFSLNVTTDVNSVGPTGFNRWKLVSAFYADTASSVGSFIKSLTGSPESDFLSYSTLPTTSTGIMLNYALASFFKRSGQNMDLRLRLTFTGTSTWGGLFIPMPNVHTIYTARELGMSDDVRINDVGTQEYSGLIRVEGATSFQLFHEIINNFSGSAPLKWTQISSTSPFTFNNGDGIHANISVPVTNWDTTPIAYL